MRSSTLGMMFTINSTFGFGSGSHRSSHSSSRSCRSRPCDTGSTHPTGVRRSRPHRWRPSWLLWNLTFGRSLKVHSVAASLAFPLGRQHALELDRARLEAEQRLEHLAAHVEGLAVGLIGAVQAADRQRPCERGLLPQTESMKNHRKADGVRFPVPFTSDEFRRNVTMTRTVARQLAVQIGFSVAGDPKNAQEALDAFFDKDYFSSLADEKRAFRRISG